MFCNLINPFSVFFELRSAMVTIKFAFLVVIFSATSVYTTCIVDKFKSVRKPSNEDLCRKQFDSFIEALESNQRWAKESKLNFEKRTTY